MAQSSNTCADAQQICAGQQYEGSTENGAAFNFPGACFNGPNTVWFTFFTGSVSGLVTVTLDNITEIAGVATSNRIRAAILENISMDACNNPSDFQVVSSRCPTGNSTIQLTATTLQANTQYWIIVDGLDRNETNQQIPPAICSFNLSISGPAVEISTSGDVTIFSGSTVQLQAFGSTDNNYEWSPEAGLDGTIGSAVNASPESTSLYQVSASISGCNLTASLQVEVLENILPYEVFSPNNDGFNEEWDIPGLALFPRAIVKVYSHLGQLVFESIGYSQNQRWKGNFNGNPLPANTYFYIIDINQRGINSELIKGKITLVR